MRAIVTGAAGFIGSHVAESLLSEGHHVLGIDTFSDSYAPSLKRENVGALIASPFFELVEADLATCELESLLRGNDIVFHHAAQSGVRTSFADGFSAYCVNNVLTTQRLLEAAKATVPSRLVFASSSSVYGNASAYPTREDALPRPYSPYGVTKLAAEHLCSLYAANWGVSTVMLRYFTVYGPRQRPDMAFHRLLNCALEGRPFPLYGDGHQVRDFTYVADVVNATLIAAEIAVEPGTVINVSGGTNVSMLEIIRIVEDLTDSRVQVVSQPTQAGDVEKTGGSTERARSLLGWYPKVGLRDGLDLQLRWHIGRAGDGRPTAHG
jgi:nucleoside-diphosphate-sugar epimerase